MSKRKLTLEEIANKEFHIDFKGYDAKEVDSFLDLIVEDYQQFEQQLLTQQTLLSQYEETSSSQAKRIAELESKLTFTEEESALVNPADLLRRVSRLEQALHEGLNKKD